jgi:hypothetical protein
MTDAPNKIWATGNKTTGSWNHTPLSLRIAPVQTEYVRADISQARIAELETALLLMVSHEVNYMDINNLGDPEEQHRIKQARAALKAKP